MTRLLGNLPSPSPFRSLATKYVKPGVCDVVSAWSAADNQVTDDSDDDDDDDYSRHDTNTDVEHG